MDVDARPLACILILHPELKEDIIFRPRIVQKRFFTEKYIFHVPLHPFQGAKVESALKLTLGRTNKR